MSQQIVIMRGGRSKSKEVIKFNSKAGNVSHVSRGNTPTKKTNNHHTSTFVKKANACIHGANEGMVQGVVAGAVVGAVGAGGGAVPGAIIGGASGAISGCVSGVFKYNI